MPVWFPTITLLDCLVFPVLFLSAICTSKNTLPPKNPNQTNKKPTKRFGDYMSYRNAAGKCYLLYTIGQRRKMLQKIVFLYPHFTVLIPGGHPFSSLELLWLCSYKVCTETFKIHHSLPLQKDIITVWKLFSNMNRLDQPSETPVALWSGTNWAGRETDGILTTVTMILINSKATHALGIWRKEFYSVAWARHVWTENFNLRNSYFQKSRDNSSKKDYEVDKSQILQ